MANKRSKQGVGSYTTKIYSNDGKMIYESHTENLKLDGYEIDYMRHKTLLWINGKVDYNSINNRKTISSLIEENLQNSKIEKKIEKDIKNNILSSCGHNSITSDDKAAIKKLQKEKKITTRLDDPKDTHLHISKLWSHEKDIYLDIDDSNIIEKLTIEEFRSFPLDQFFQVNQACILINFITKEIYTNCATVIHTLDENLLTEKKPKSMLTDFDNKIVEDNDWNAIKKSLYFFDKVTR